MTGRDEKGITAKLQLVSLLYFISINLGKRFTLRDIEKELSLAYTSVDNLLTRAVEYGYLKITSPQQKRSFILQKGGVTHHLKLTKKGFKLLKTIAKDLNTQKLVFIQLFSVALTLFISFAVFLITGFNYAASIAAFILSIIISSASSTHYAKKERLRFLKKLLAF